MREAVNRLARAFGSAAALGVPRADALEITLIVSALLGLVVDGSSGGFESPTDWIVPLSAVAILLRERSSDARGEGERASGELSILERRRLEEAVNSRAREFLVLLASMSFFGFVGTMVFEDLQNLGTLVMILGPLAALWALRSGRRGVRSLRDASIGG